jgi:membrane-associated protein
VVPLRASALDASGEPVDLIVGFFSWIFALLRDPGPVIEQGGLPALALIIFLETGALIFFLPGDSLLVVAGLYASDGIVNIWGLNIVLPLCAIVGDATSYFIGQRTGPSIFSRPKSLLFNPAHVIAARDFYEKHGGKAIIIARFMPVVRTFVPVVAGIAGMPYRRFALYNVIGAFAWVMSMTLMGYFLGDFEIVRRHLEKVIILVVVISVLPGLIGWLRSRGSKKDSSKGDEKKDSAAA